jgi:hypothetical protein
MEHYLILPMMRMRKMFCFFDHFLNLVLILPQNIVDPIAGSSGSGHGAANSAEDLSHPLTNIRDLLQVINIVCQFCYSHLLSHSVRAC